MRIIKGFDAISEKDRGACVALGNFDGVHLGHMSVIGRAQLAAKARAAQAGVVTFEPHPRSFFAPDAPPFRLMNETSRAHRLERVGLDSLYVLPFDADMAGRDAESFARDVIGPNGLGVQHVVTGADFRFGKGRAGDAALLGELGAEYGFTVEAAPLLAAGGKAVSSTAIRAALSEGRPDIAHDMLGHWHRIDGAVQHGDKRGRDLGFPTANMNLEGLHMPCFGVYAVLVDVLEGPHKGSYHGAASIGVRPTFGVNKPNIEVFLFDFKGDLYGTPISVGLVSYLRGEEKFDGLDALITQMHADCDLARERLAAVS